MKKIAAREVIVLTVSILIVVILWGLTITTKSFRTKQLTTEITDKKSALDSLEKIDFNRKLLFYFSEVEAETFLDRLYKDYKTSVFKNTPTFSALIDSLKEYNGILYTSFDFVLMEESKQPSYLQDLKYPDFEKKVKNSISIYDRILPEEVLYDIRKRELDQEIDNNYIDRFWSKAINSPDLVFNKLTESHRKYFDFATINNFKDYLNKYSDTTYRKSISEIEIQIKSLKEDEMFWKEINTSSILLYISIAVFGLLYVVRGLWFLLSWAIKNKK